MAGGRLWHWLAALGVLGVAAALALPVVVYTDVAYVCENTGSKYGYREGPFGGVSERWYKASPLESFIERESPRTLVHRWTKYRGTGRNFLGRPTAFGHGSPGGMFGVSHERLAEWIARHDEAEVVALYDELRTTPPGQTRAVVERIEHELATKP
jgi:hypothetical protein